MVGGSKSKGKATGATRGGQQSAGSRPEQGGGFLALVRAVPPRFFADDQQIYAAALSYATLFALFPFLLLVLWLTSFFVPSSDGLTRLVNRLLDVPGAGTLFAQSFSEVFANRNNLGLPGALGLIFGSLAPVSIAEVAANRAWGCRPRRGWRRWRWLVLASMTLMGFLTSATLIVTTVFRLLRRFLDVSGPAAENRSILVSLALFVVLSLGAFLLGYRFLPNRPTRWREIMPGVFAATGLWLVLAGALAAYLLTLGDPAIRYGALGPVIAFLVWGYALALVFCLGVEISAHPSRR